MENPDRKRSDEILAVVLSIGLFLMAACLLLKSVEFRPRYALAMAPVALLLLILASIKRGEFLQQGAGRLVLTFGVMICYNLSSTALLEVPSLKEQFPWLLPWRTIVLTALVVVWIYGLVSRACPASGIAGLWQPVLWSVGLIVLCGLAIKLSVDHMAAANEAYRASDSLDPKFKFVYLLYRCVEYGLLFLVASSPAGSRSWRVLGFAVAGILILKALWH